MTGPRTRHPRHLVTLSLGMLLLAGGSVPAGAQDGSPEPESGSSPDPAASASPSPAAASTFDPDSVAIRTELVTDDGLTAPVYITDDGTGRPCLYVVERGGSVRVLADGVVRSSPFLDISGLVAGGAEQGLHSIAFHPEFGRNGRFFVHFNDLENRTRISEFRGRPCRAARAREVRRLIVEVQPEINNNAGWIGFGRDGYLYIPLGDGGGVSPGDPNGIGQAREPRLSKVLRIDVDRGRRYGIPPDNPYAERKRRHPRETWAKGLRDPRRSSFDRATGDLWIGDVGQDRYEEVNRVPAGVGDLNFGWSDMEGDRCHNLPDCDPADHTLPVHVYDQVSPHCGIVGGYVYRGEAIPELQGVYLFSDFCSGFIWGLDAEAVAAGGEAVAHQLLDAPQGFVSFGEDDAGELYVVALDGSIYRIEAEVSG